MAGFFFISFLSCKFTQDFFLSFSNNYNMDNRQHYQKIADVDIYDPYVNEGSSQASAPPQSEIYTPLIHSHAQQYSQPQPQQYQTIQMPIPHTYTQEAPTYTYIIRKRGADGRQFPIQASICLLGW